MSKPTYDLYRPSLKEGWNQTKTYDINRLFFVAFFGGVIPMMVLGIRNSKWLKLPKLQTYFLLATSVLVLLAEVVILYIYANDTFTEGSRIPRVSVKILSILLFFLYQYVLNKPFQQHLYTNGEVEPILKSALLWITLGVIIQFTIVAILFMVTGKVE